MVSAHSIRVRGIVQGVGFRPFVFRLARAHALAGSVMNGEEGVEILLEGDEEDFNAFLLDLKAYPPPAAQISEVVIQSTEAQGLAAFTIGESLRRERPTVRISPDLPVCEACIKELFDPANPRYRYPYINCTDCGPRYSVIEALPYDRPQTTMKAWPMDDYCAREYSDPANRRFHAQPVACPECGPHYHFVAAASILPVTADPPVAPPAPQHASNSDDEAVSKTADLLRSGGIVAIISHATPATPPPSAHSASANSAKRNRLR